MTAIGTAAGRSWSARSAILPVLLAAALILTFAVGALSYWAYERHFLALKASWH